ncbi:hypothetical protein Tco_1285094 [Tanacetum coccineum]
MIAPSSSRYSSNDIVHNHYLEEAKKKTHEHSRIPRNFSDSKHFVCSTCQKCVFNANHDACVIKFLKEVNSCAKVPSNKTTNRNKPVEQIRVATKPKRQIPKGHRFSIKKTTTVHEKTTSPRSCLRWQPTGRILKTVCLRWVPTGKTFASSTTKVESEPQMVSNADITNQCESKQALNVSAVQASVVNDKWCLLKITLQAPFLNVKMMSVHISSGLVLHQMTSDHNRSELGIQDHSNEPSSFFKKLVLKVCSSSSQDSYITTRVGITIPPSYSNAEDNRTVTVIALSIHNDDGNPFQWSSSKPALNLRKEKKVKGREKIAKGSRKKMLGRKRAGKEQQEESSKKQKLEKEKESDKVDEVDEAELKKLLVIKKDEDIAIDAIPVATKLPVDY